MIKPIFMGKGVSKATSRVGGFVSNAWGKAKAFEQKVSPYVEKGLEATQPFMKQIASACPKCEAGIVGVDSLLHATDKRQAIQNLVGKHAPAHADIVNHMGNMAQKGYDAYNSYAPTEGGNVAIGRVKAAAQSMYQAQHDRRAIERGGTPHKVELMDAVRSQAGHLGRFQGLATKLAGRALSNNPLHPDIGL